MQKRLERTLFWSSIVTAVLGLAGLVVIHLPDQLNKPVPLDFRISYVIAADGSAAVTETLDYDFTTPRSVVKRRYPFAPEGVRPDGWQVTRNGEPTPIALLAQEYVIGNPAVGYTGHNRYVIRYRLARAASADGTVVINQVLTPRSGVDLRSFRISVEFPLGGRALQCRIGPRACRVSGSGSPRLEVALGPQRPATEFLMRAAASPR